MINNMTSVVKIVAPAATAIAASFLVKRAIMKPKTKITVADLADMSVEEFLEKSGYTEDDFHNEDVIVDA